MARHTGPAGRRVCWAGQGRAPPPCMASPSTVILSGSRDRSRGRLPCAQPKGRTSFATHRPASTTPNPHSQGKEISRSRGKLGTCQLRPSTPRRLGVGGSARDDRLGGLRGIHPVVIPTLPPSPRPLPKSSRLEHALSGSEGRGGMEGSPSPPTARHPSRPADALRPRRCLPFDPSASLRAGFAQGRLFRPDPDRLRSGIGAPVEMTRFASCAALPLRARPGAFAPRQLPCEEKWTGRT